MLFQIELLNKPNLNSSFNLLLFEGIPRALKGKIEGNNSRFETKFFSLSIALVCPQIATMCRSN